MGEILKGSPYFSFKTREQILKTKTFILGLFLAVFLGAGILLSPFLGKAASILSLLDSAPLSSLPVPVQGIHPFQLVDTWGGPRPGGRLHQGIDIFAKSGTPVLSTTEGLLLKKGEDPIGGKFMFILGPGGYGHYYAHLKDWGAQSEGSWIRAKEVIGLVGNTGNAKTTPPHLHYGVYRWTGEAINPYPLFAKPNFREKKSRRN